MFIKEIDEKIWEKSGVFFNKLKTGEIVKHILPNNSFDYTRTYEIEDILRYSRFCRKKCFYDLMEMEVAF